MVNRRHAVKAVQGIQAVGHGGVAHGTPLTVDMAGGDVVKSVVHIFDACCFTEFPQIAGVPVA